MELIRGHLNLKKEISGKHRGCIVTIGNFDGVHLGHQHLLARVKTKSTQLKMPSMVILFEPHPVEFFMGNQSPARLMRLREKLPALAVCGVDRVLCIRFNDAFAHLTAEQFIQDILVKGLGVRHIVIGDDFHFGYKRVGDFPLLERYGAHFNFTVETMPTFIIDNERVSSTRIRKMLEQGDLERAKRLLGHPFALSGHVTHGNKLGRVLGMPTANIYLHRRVVPILGIYAVRILDLEKQPLYGVACVGNRPTVDGTRCLLEVYIFDFDQDIYGRHITVEFAKKLRDEVRFSTLEALKEQMFKDAQEAKEYFMHFDD